MRVRRFARLATFGLASGFLVPLSVGLTEAPALGYSVNADDTTADVVLDGSSGKASPFSDHTTVRVRVLRPTNFTKPQGGYSLIIDLHGTTVNRCGSEPFASRTELAAQGYVVLSFNQRGHANSLGALETAGNCPDVPNEIADGLNDDGSTYGGPRDAQDISELITWARDHTWGGTNPCSSACINENKVGVIGFSQGGSRTMAMGIPRPGTCTKSFDCRIKALVPLAYANFRFDRIAAVSGDGTNAIPAAPSTGYNLWDSGWHEMLTERRFGISLNAMARSVYLPKTNSTIGTTLNSSTITVSAAPLFSYGDIGRQINITGAGSGGNTLEATITAVNTAGTQATLSGQAAASLSGLSGTWLSPPDSQNDSGTVASGALTTLTVTGSPGFKPGDVGSPISVAGAGPLLVGSNQTLWTTIAAVNSATSVTLADPAKSGGVSNARTRWGSRAIQDRYHFVDDDPAVDKVHAWTVPTFLVQGWLDGSAGIFNSVGIEAFNKMPSTAGAYTSAPSDSANDVAKYLYLGSCSHGPDPCLNPGSGVNPRADIQSAVFRFLDRYVNNNAAASVGTKKVNSTAQTINNSTTLRLTGGTTLFSADDLGKPISVTSAAPNGTLNTVIDQVVSTTEIVMRDAACSNCGGSLRTATWGCLTTGPCVFYALPAKWVSDSNNPYLTPTAAMTSPVWPPVLKLSQTYYLHNNHVLDTSSTVGNTTAYETMTNNFAARPFVDLCLGKSYLDSESLWFESAAAASDGRMAKFTADLWVSTDVSRLQVFTDLFVVRSNVNTTATIASGDLTKLTVAGAPKFTQWDKGEPISITGSAPWGATLFTTIDSVFDANTVFLTTAASSAGSGRTASWTAPFRVWQGGAQVTPVLNNLGPSQVNQPQRFVFQPAGAGWTLATGQKLRLKIATNDRPLPTEPFKTTNVRLYHDNANSRLSSFTVMYV